MQNTKNQGLPIGTVLHGKVYTYTIEKMLGQGAFGITYLASTSMKGPLGEVTVQVALKEFFAKELDSRMSDGTVTAIILFGGKGSDPGGEPSPHSDSSAVTQIPEEMPVSPATSDAKSSSDNPPATSPTQETPGSLKVTSNPSGIEKPEPIE